MDTKEMFLDGYGRKNVQYECFIKLNSMTLTLDFCSKYDRKRHLGWIFQIYMPGMYWRKSS